MGNVSIRPRAKGTQVAGHGRKSIRRSTRLTDEQRQESLKYLDLCEKKAKKFSKKCPHVSEEDFFQTLYEGLADAIKGFDKEKILVDKSPSQDEEDYLDRKFRSFADLRMVGACLDMMRDEGTVRIKRQGHRNKMPAFGYVSIDVGARYSHHGHESGRETGTAGDWLLPSSSEPRPGDELESSDSFDAWLRGFGHDERFVVREYIVNGRSMKQIGRDLDLTESRISQMFSKIIARLRERARDPRYRLLADYRELASA